MEDAERIATVSDLAGRDVSYGEVVEALSEGFASALDIEFRLMDWTGEMDARVNVLLPIYQSDTTREIPQQAVHS